LIKQPQRLPSPLFRLKGAPINRLL